MTLSPAGTVQSLLRRLADGDSVALAELYDRAAPLVFGVALRVADDETAAEAAVEQAFAEMWRDRRATAGRAPTGIVPLLARAREIALSQRSGDPEASRERGWLGADSEAAERVLAMSEDDRASAVGRAVMGLSPAEQRVLDRAYFEGRSMSDIADDMGVEPDEARRLLRSALVALRAEIDSFDATA